MTDRTPGTPGTLETRFSRLVGIRTPLICGAMYPCSNPELVAAVSEAGGIGIVQPMSMIYVHGHDLREGLRLIRSSTSRPFGFNAILQRTVRAYEDRMRRWIDIALEEGAKLIITALGSPRWVVERARPLGVPVFHDVIHREHAEKARDQGVDGLICVNDRAGGHLGTRGPRELLDELQDMGLPLVCAGGVGRPEEFAAALRMGYDAVQMGTRFIATEECSVHDDYKQAIVRAGAEDIIVTDKLDGVDCSVIRTPYFDRTGARAGPLARRLLRGRYSKRLMRLLYAVRGIWTLKRAAREGTSYRDVYQAGRSVAGIESIDPAGDVVARFHRAAAAAAVV
jgi:nitronate monooxygenase